MTGYGTPKSGMERMLREEVLAMAATEPFARRLVNSGRLSLPCALDGLSLQSDDDPAFAGGLAPGRSCVDAPVIAMGGQTWLLEAIGGRFVVLSFGRSVEVPDGVAQLVVVATDQPASADKAFIVDAEGLVAARYGGQPGAAYLIRPDQHVAARFLRPTREAIAAAFARAMGRRVG